MNPDEYFLAHKARCDQCKNWCDIDVMDFVPIQQSGNNPLLFQGIPFQYLCPACHQKWRENQ